MDIADKLIHQVASDRNILELFPPDRQTFPLDERISSCLSLSLSSGAGGWEWGRGGAARIGCASTWILAWCSRHVTLTVKVMSVDP